MKHLQLKFKPNQLLACIFIIAAEAYATWMGGWYVYDALKLWQQTPSPDFQNILLAACAALAIPVIAFTLLRSSGPVTFEAVQDNPKMIERLQETESKLGSLKQDFLKQSETIADLRVGLALKPDSEEEKVK
jgi:hypothetical protein